MFTSSANLLEKTGTALAVPAAPLPPALQKPDKVIRFLKNQIEGGNTILTDHGSPITEDLGEFGANISRRKIQ